MDENTASPFPLTILVTENNLTSFWAGYTPCVRGGWDSDSDDGYEADNERNDDESADEASDDDDDDDRGSGGTSTAADHWDDSDADSDNCYTSDNGE
jgi:hypothetical protein